MSDTTMCTGEGCLATKYCYRFTAPVNEYRQSYFQIPPHIDGVCQHFIFNEVNEDTNNNGPTLSPPEDNGLLLSSA